MNTIPFATGTSLRQHDGFRYGIAREEHGDAIVHVLSESFVHDPLSKALGLTAADLACLVKRFIPECTSNGLSVIAVPEDEPSTVAGVFINRDFKANLPPGVPDELPFFAPIADALQNVDSQYEALRPGLLPGQAIDLWMVGVAPDGRFARRGIASALFEVSVELSRRCGFERCVVECTGFYSQRAAVKAGFQPMTRLVYKEHEFGGRRIFASVPPPHADLILYERLV